MIPNYQNPKVTEQDPFKALKTKVKKDKDGSKKRIDGMPPLYAALSKKKLADVLTEALEEKVTPDELSQDLVIEFLQTSVAKALGKDRVELR